MSEVLPSIKEMLKARRTLGDVMGAVLGRAGGATIVSTRLNLPSGKPSTFLRHDWHAKAIQGRVVPPDPLTR